jgi:hypothetical protein
MIVREWHLSSSDVQHTRFAHDELCAAIAGAAETSPHTPGSAPVHCVDCDMLFVVTRRGPLFWVQQHVAATTTHERWHTWFTFQMADLPS